MEEKDRKERMGLKRKYTTYFVEFFENLKKEFVKGIGNKEDDEFSSVELAFRDVISALPCPVSVVRITIDVKKYTESKNNVYHLIKYDFSNFGEFSIKYYGVTDLDEIEKHKKLMEDFKLNQNEIKELKSFKLRGYGDPEFWYWVLVIRCDILEKREECTKDFMKLFWTTFGHQLLEKFEKRIDYNTKYGLKSDPVLPVSELLKKDITLSPFVKADKSGEYHEITLEDLQKSVCDIQLITTVPEGVRKVFSAAKRLHIFAYFEYYFFTISQHYAFLALESALRNKYNEVNCKHKKFIKLHEIIKELVQKGTIPKGEANRYDAGRHLRNCLSHLSDPPILMPTSSLLRRVAYQINQIWTQPITTGK